MWPKGFIQLFSSHKCKKINPEWWHHLPRVIQWLLCSYFCNWRINTFNVSWSHSFCPSQPSRYTVWVTTALCSWMWSSCSPWLSNPIDWFLVDQEDAGGEDGPRGCGTRARGGEHHRGGGEHLDCQPLWPPREDLESWATSKAGKDCVDSPCWAKSLSPFTSSFPTLF